MKTIKDILAERILVLDGALSSFIEKYNLREYDYHKNRFINHSKSLYGFYEVLSFTDPRFVQELHERYLKAGSDIIVTNTFRANEYFLDQYDLSGLAYEMNFTAAKLAREMASKYSIIRRNKPRFVFGSVGPVPQKLTEEEYKKVYSQQLKGLLAGNVDGIMVECISDKENLFAILSLLEEIMAKRKRRIFVIIAADVRDEVDLKLDKAQLEDIANNFAYLDILAVGLCCGDSPDKMFASMRKLSEEVDYPTVVCPRAGEKDEEDYLSAPEFVASVKRYLDEKMVNLIGGSDGTTPEYIELLSKLVKEYQPREFNV